MTRPNYHADNISLMFPASCACDIITNITHRPQYRVDLSPLFFPPPHRAPFTIYVRTCERVCVCVRAFACVCVRTSAWFTWNRGLARFQDWEPTQRCLRVDTQAFVSSRTLLRPSILIPFRNYRISTRNSRVTGRGTHEEKLTVRAGCSRDTIMTNWTIGV